MSQRRLTGLMVLLLFSAVGRSNYGMATQGCSDQAEKVGWLGITALESERIRSIDSNRDLQIWLGREPEVVGILPGGPADGKLQKGDVLVSIDGMLITTRSAGRRLARPTPGATTRLEVRRQGEMRQVEIQPLAICPEDVPRFYGTPSIPPPPPVPQPTPPAPLAPPQALAPAALPPPAPPSAPLPPTPPAPPESSAWFGFGFECDDCGWEPGSPRLFRFRGFPTLYSVDQDSPAGRAGLKRGDVLLKIDGIPLTSRQGSERFFSVEGGEKVKIEYRRDANVFEAELEAVSPSARIWTHVSDRISRFQEDLQQRIDQLARSGKAAEIREEVSQQIDRLVESFQNASWPSASDFQRNLRYAGMIGNVDLDVRGLGSVDVTVAPDGRSIFIRTLDSTIRLSAR